MEKLELRDIKLDGVKGFLILCIILEHNSLLTNEYDWIRPFCDAFAVGSFFLITFIWPLNYTTFTSFFDKYFSYWVPYVVFTVIISILNAILYGYDGLTSEIYTLFKAIIIASPYEIKQSSGFMYLWFLPCLSVLYLVRMALSKTWLFSMIFPALSLLFLGDIDDETLIKTPYSLHVIGFIYLLGIIYSKLHKVLIREQFIIQVTLIILFLGLSITSYTIGWQLFLAGGVMPSWEQPLIIIYYCIFMLISIPSIYSIMGFMPKIILMAFAYLGQQSLKIYLIHPLVFILLTTITNIISGAVLSYAITILITTLISYLITKSPLIMSLVFPSKTSLIIKKLKS